MRSWWFMLMAVAGLSRVLACGSSGGEGGSPNDGSLDQDASLGSDGLASEGSVAGQDASTPDVMPLDGEAGEASASCTALFQAAAEDVPFGETSISVNTGDFNRDSKRDFVALDIQGALHVVLGNGDGTFRAPMNSALPSGPQYYFVATADLNGDSKEDLAISSDTQLLILLGAGDGTFSAPATYALVMSGREIATADFNRDAKIDVAVGLAGPGIGGFAVFIGNGDGTLQPATTLDAGIPMYGIDEGDLNSDGIPDLVGAGPATYVLASSDGGGFAPAVQLPGRSADDSARIGDFNHDGKPDIAAGGYELQVYYGNGAGAFQPPVTVLPPTGGAQNFRFAVGELNGDQATDGVLVGYVNSIANVMLSAPDGGTGLARTYSTPYQPSSGLLADFNGDSKLDLLVGAGEAVSLRLGIGAGAFETSGEIDAGDAPNRVFVGDFNGDHTLDLLTTSTNLPFFVELGNPDGTFQQPVEGPPTSSLGTSVAAEGIWVGDVNNDLLPDVAVTYYDVSYHVAVFRGQGGTSFATPQVMTANVGSGPLTGGDFNGDGKVDLAVGVSSGNLDVYPGNGDGTFGTPTTFTLCTCGLSIVALSAVDLDGDGHLDLAYAGNPGTVTAVMNTGDGGFVSGSAQGVASGVSSLAAGDFNGDGRPDLAVGNSTKNKNAVAITLWGDGGLQPAHALSTGFMPNGVAAADVNGDGKIDLLTANNQSGSLGALLGNGDGTFKPVRLFRAGQHPTAVAAGDFNHDGTTDVVVTNAGGPSVGVIAGMSASVFLRTTCP